MKYGNKTFGHAEAIFNILGGELVVDQILTGELIVTVTPKVVVPTPPPPPLLTLVRTFDLPPRTTRFEAKKHFTLGKAKTGRKARPSIGYIDPDFNTYYSPKIEEPTSGGSFTTHTLNRSATVAEISSELGEEKSETTLSDVYALISLQPNGEEGVLLTNGYANLFKVRDAQGNLRVVCVYWNAGYGDWGVYENSLGYGWDVGDRFVSR